MALIDTVRSVVKETLLAMKPALVLTATVDSIEPLRLMVDNRFYLEEQMLLVPDIYRPEQETEDHRHSIPEHETELAFEHEPSEHDHAIPEHETEKVIYKGLQPGQHVVLLRNQGGEQFVILGRLV